MGFNIGSYYLVGAATDKALAGPMKCLQVVALIIAMGDQTEQAKYYNASRYLLAKHGLYPRTKAGEAALARDIAAAQKTIE